eukprot:CAMPEP_0181468920 /NCGR_PEP_ID=MMETSP1110-20121109/37736_1 /TAXON_ID=174948 /ORGANISM="Symbiodinium sp., Strain CCMP421" /LENGTH=41 /DNA_ID= /DNA_START= /DNA_END= /DNA_ORIENTATION=
MLVQDPKALNAPFEDFPPTLPVCLIRLVAWQRSNDVYARVN